MKKGNRSNVRKSFQAAVLTAAIVSSSAAAVFASESLAPEIGVTAQREANDGYVEYEGPITKEASSIIDLNPLTRTATCIIVPKADRVETTGFTAKAGQTLRILANGFPSSVSYKIGYLDSSTQYYCEAQGEFSHEFTIPKTGDYRVFVENNSSTTDLQLPLSYVLFFQ